jgi:hypothetical protein
MIAHRLLPLSLCTFACVSNEVVEHLRPPSNDAAIAGDAEPRGDALTQPDAGADAGSPDSEAGDARVNMIPDGGPTDAGRARALPICSSDRWCWERPLPQGNDLHAAWAAAPDELWVVGDSGTILHFDHGTWRGEQSGTIRSLYAVWGTGSDDVWAAGSSGTMLHFDGSRWSPVPSTVTQPIRSIWGSRSDDVWAVGDGSTLIHWNGSEWLSAQHPQTNHLLAVWGTAADDVWAAGVFGAILHYNGQTWTASQSGTNLQISTLWGRARDEVYAGLGFSDIGPGGLLRFDGQRWSPVTGAPSDYVQSIFGTAQEIWLLGADAFDARTIWRFDGQWTSEPSPVPPGLTSIAGAGGALWIAGKEGALIERSGTSWIVHGEGGAPDLHDVFGFASDDVWAVGQRGTILHRDADEWSVVQNATGTSVDLYGVWGAAPNDVWAVGNPGIIEHWDGSRWTMVASTTNGVLSDVWGSGPRDVWAVGNEGFDAIVLHYDGMGWSRETLTNGGTLTGVWVGAPGEVWISTFGGSVRQRTTSGWVDHSGVAGGESRAIHGLVRPGQASEVWVIGFGGVGRWDGVGWTPISGSSGEAIFATGSGGWWAGRSGTIQRWDGALITYGSGTELDFDGFFALSSGESWAVGRRGMILRRVQ